MQYIKNIYYTDYYQFNVNCTSFNKLYSLVSGI